MSIIITPTEDTEARLIKQIKQAKEEGDHKLALAVVRQLRRFLKDQDDVGGGHTENYGRSMIPMYSSPQMDNFREDSRP